MAADHDIVTHVAVLAGDGVGQLYSLLSLARSGEFFGRVSSDGGERVDYVLKQWEQIRADPDNPDRLFFGHPYRRWTSFLRTSTLDQLLQTEAAIFLAQGTDDLAVAPESSDILVAGLGSRGKEVEFRRVNGADHNFRINGAEPVVDLWPDVVGEAVSWFLATGA